MNREKTILYALLLISPLFLCSCATVGIEKAKYEVIKKEGKFEVRQYQPQKDLVSSPRRHQLI